MSYRNVYRVDHDKIPNDALDRAATGERHRIVTHVLAANAALAKAAFLNTFPATRVAQVSLANVVDIEVEVK
jgi:hypothetical protein